MPKKKEEPEVAAAVETTESAAEVTDIEPVPVEPAAEVSAEPIEPAAEEPPKPKRTRKKKTDVYFYCSCKCSHNNCTKAIN